MKKIFLILLVVGTIFSCQQEHEWSGEIPNSRNPENELEAFLKIDQAQFTARIDQVINYSFTEMTHYDLMLDGDEIADLRFSITGVNEPLGTYIREIKVETLSDNTTIGVATEEERLCSYQETTNEGEVKFIENYDANRSYNGTLDIEDPTDIVSPAIFRQGEEIDRNAGFESGAFLLSYHDGSNQLNPDPALSFRYNIEYGNWNGIDNGFLAVQIQKEEHVFYVWLKLEIIDFEQIKLFVYKIKEVRV